MEAGCQVEQTEEPASPFHPFLFQQIVFGDQHQGEDNKGEICENKGSRGRYEDTWRQSQNEAGDHAEDKDSRGSQSLRLLTEGVKERPRDAEAEDDGEEKLPPEPQ